MFQLENKLACVFWEHACYVWDGQTCSSQFHEQKVKWKVRTFGVGYFASYGCERQLRTSAVAYPNIIYYNSIAMKMCTRPKRDLCYA